MTKHDIRCKGTKTDAELLEEYFQLQEPREWFVDYDGWSHKNENYQEELEAYRQKKSDLEEVIGQDIIRYETRIRSIENGLDFRMKKMESALQKLESRKRFFFF